MGAGSGRGGETVTGPITHQNLGCAGQPTHQPLNRAGGI